MPNTSLREAAPTTSLLRPFLRQAQGRQAQYKSVQVPHVQCPLPNIVNS
ncbi:hypothetical protein [Nostoc sp.]